MIASLRAFATVEIRYFQSGHLGISLHSLIHPFILELCTMLTRSFSDVQFPSGPDNIWRLVRAEEGISTESHKSHSGNPFNCQGLSCSSLQRQNCGHGTLHSCINARNSLRLRCNLFIIESFLVGSWRFWL